LFAEQRKYAVFLIKFAFLPWGQLGTGLCGAAAGCQFYGFFLPLQKKIFHFYDIRTPKKLESIRISY